jgi:ligand-binding sensor domain-containing protein
MTTDHQGGIWLFHPDSGLFRYADGTITKLPAQPAPGNRNQVYLYVDHRGRVWLGQFNRVSRYDGESVRVFGPENGIPPGVPLTITDD